MSLTVPEVAARLRLTPGRVRQLIRAGKIPAYRPGGRNMLIDADELQRFIEASRVSPAGAPEGGEPK